MSGGGDERRDPGAILATIGLVALVALVYVPGALTNQWAVDDTRFILENTFVRAPQGAAGWLALLIDPVTVDPVSPGGIMRPLRTLEFAVDHALFGVNPAAFHLHSLAWHLLATVFAFHVLRRLAGRTRPALVGAAIWALHPMQVEAVAWVSSRGDVAMGACTFAALWFALRSSGRDRWLVAALAAGALAMLYKETAIVLPLLVFAVRIGRPRGTPSAPVVPALRTALPYLVLAMVYFALRSWMEVASFTHARTFVLGGSTSGTFGTVFRSIGAYVVMAVLPVRSDHDWYLDPSTSVLEPGALAWLAALVGLIALAVAMRRRRSLLAAGISLFLFPLIPVANWPFQLGIPTSERFLYLSLLGLALVVADAARRRPALLAAALAALAMAVISYERTLDWHDDDVLLVSSLRHGTSPRAASWFAARERTAAAELERRSRRTDDPVEKERLEGEARDGFERALALAHRSLDLWHRFEKVSHSISAVVIDAHINAANSALYLGRPAEALWHADRAIAADHDDRFMQPHYNRAIALAELGRPAEAIDAFDRALDLGAARDGAVVRRSWDCGQACIDAGAFGHAERAFRIVHEAQPELGNRGLALLEDAVRAAAVSATTPQQRALGLARVGAPVPPEIVATLADGAVRDFVAGCMAERAGADADALPLFQRALVAGGLPAPCEQRARRSSERIQEGCSAWRDHAPDELDE